MSVYTKTICRFFEIKPVWCKVAIFSPKSNCRSELWRAPPGGPAQKTAAKNIDLIWGRGDLAGDFRAGRSGGVNIHL